MSARAAQAPKPPRAAERVSAPARLALRRSEAAQALGVSDEVFDAHVRPFVPVVRLASVRVYPVAGLRAFLDREASAPMDDVRLRG